MDQKRQLLSPSTEEYNELLGQLTKDLRLPETDKPQDKVSDFIYLGEVMEITGIHKKPFTPRESIKSEYITSKERKSFLTTLRGNLINEGKEGTKLYNKVLSAINRDAEALGISPNEYIQVDVSEQPSSSQGLFYSFNCPIFSL